MAAEIPEALLAVLDEENVIVSAEAASRWPSSVVAAFEAMGVLVPTVEAEQVLCDACDDQHAVEVVRIGDCRYGACPAEGRIEIEPSRVRQWRTNPDAFAARLGEELGGKIRAMLAGRLWDLGSVNLGVSRRKVLVARGLRREGSAATLERASVESGRTPSVLLAIQTPAEPPRTDGAPIIFAVAAVVGLEDGRLRIRKDAFVELQPLRTHVAGERLAAPKGATWEDVTLVVSPERLRVEVWSRGDLEVDRTLGYGEAGFVDRREMKPNDSWSLLRDLASNGGVAPSEIARAQKPRVSNLRRALKALLPIDGDPIRYEEKEYRAAFLTREDGPFKPLRMPRGATWRDVSILIEHRNRLRVLVRGEGFFVDREQLGLSGRDGRPTRAGEALEALAKTSTIDGGLDDQGLLELNKALKGLGVTDDPFHLTDIPRGDRPGGDDSRYARRWKPLFALGDGRSR